MHYNVLPKTPCRVLHNAVFWFESHKNELLGSKSNNWFSEAELQKPYISMICKL
jgi:hypothetical protein